MGADFGTLLKEFRLRAGFGLRRFAQMVDLAPSNLSAIEHGRREPPAGADHLREIADSLGLVEGSADWNRFFDAASRRGELPPDVQHLAERKLIPVLLRTIDNQKLSDTQIEQLVDEINRRGGE